MSTSLVALTIAASASIYANGDLESPESHTRIDLRVSSVVDMHFFVRWLAEQGQDAASPEWAAPAIAAVKELNTELGGSPLSWYVIEVELARCEKASEAAAAFAKLPENHTVRLPGKEKSIELRKLAAQLGAAYEKAEPQFVAEVWADHKATIETVMRLAQERLIPKQAECFAYMLDNLNIADPHMTIPVYLTASAPSPGAITHRRSGSEGVCFVAATSANGTQLLETILHEATHALDVAGDSGSVFSELRRRLQGAGFTARDREMRDVPHTVMFVHAAETIRRKLDPQHRDYGEVNGYYAKVPRATAAVRQVWVDFLDGKLMREQAIGQMVEKAVAGRENAPAKVSQP